MSDDLVKRLRTPWDADRSIISQTDNWMMERKKAADCIEELANKRDEALNQLDSARHSVSVLEKRAKTFCDGWGVADKGRIEAEAKLSKAVAFLNELNQAQSCGTTELLDIIKYLEGDNNGQ